MNRIASLPVVITLNSKATSEYVSMFLEMQDHVYVLSEYAPKQ